MGNTLGAILFLGAATWLGWTVIRGRAQNFLNAVSGQGGGGGGNGQGGGYTGGSTPPPISGPLAGVNFGVNPFQAMETPVPNNVYSEVFGQNGSLNGSGYNGPYGIFSPPQKIGDGN